MAQDVIQYLVFAILDTDSLSTLPPQPMLFVFLFFQFHRLRLDAEDARVSPAEEMDVS